jgi:hypothetical protein
MTALWLISCGPILILIRRISPYHPGEIALYYHPFPVSLLLLNRGAGYTFGSGVVRKFLEINNMNHILRAHQLCMEGFSVLFDNRLSTVWSAPNYCYRCGNSASILEIGPGESVHFNVFEAAPENQVDGPSNQPPPTAPIVKVCN